MSHEPETSDRVPSDARALSFKLSELPLIILFVPVGLFFGWHIAWLAILIRRWLRVPFLASMLVLYSALTIPFWMRCETGSVIVPVIVTGLILLLTTVPIVLAGRKEIMDGRNLEHSAPAHMMTIMAYIALPAINTIAQKIAG